MILKAMIVDDEPFVREDMQQMLMAHKSIEVICEAGTIAQAQNQLSMNRPDVVFLDIQLRGGIGFDLVPLIHKTTKIIFITAYDEYAVRAFEINALDYILKPVSPERLAEAISRLNFRENESKNASEKPCLLKPDDKVFINTGSSRYFVPLDDIIVICSIGGNYVSVDTIQGGKLICRKTIKAWDGILPKSMFARIHRATIVNMKHIKRFHSEKYKAGQVFLTGHKKSFPVSMRMIAGFKEKMAQAAVNV